MAGIAHTLFTGALQSWGDKRQHDSRDETGSGDEAGGTGCLLRTIDGEGADGRAEGRHLVVVVVFVVVIVVAEAIVAVGVVSQ